MGVKKNSRGRSADVLGGYYFVSNWFLFHESVHCTLCHIQFIVLERNWVRSLDFLELFEFLLFMIHYGFIIQKYLLISAGPGLKI